MPEEKKNPPTDGNGGRLIPRLIEEEMKDSYLNYAMSVIVSRALPDVRDGLKPSQRRILMAMNDLGLGPRGKFRKCAKIAGDTSGNYHPHGEQVVYPTLVRMAQDFSIRYELVDGQGNFGSIDGDPPAAMRYTEARMTDFAVQILEDLNRDTVDFTANYDETRQEPVVLPSKFPNLLCNGATGIAVGMATSIPPHNLAEVCNGILKLIANPDIRIPDLMEQVHGPDFPTGGIICGMRGIREAYETGRGLLTVRGHVRFEENRNRQRIIINSIPYNVQKNKLIERVADLVKEEQITGISDIRDESDRDGMRVVVEVAKGEDENVVLNQLYSATPLQETFSVIMIALVDGRPRTLNLKEMLQAYIDHRKEVIRRRTHFLLEAAQREEHILEGLAKALDVLDEIIALIRSSSGQPEAKAALMERFEFTLLQAEAILRMTLGRLTGLERDKIHRDLKDVRVKIAEYQAVLGNVNLVLDIIREDLEELRKSADKRRTEIQEQEVQQFAKEELIPEEEMVVVLSHQGFIKRVPLDSYRRQRRGGRGVIGADTKETDFIEHLFIASTHAYILFFTDTGKVHWRKVYDLPQLERTARGKPISSLLQLPKGERINTAIACWDFENGHLVLATRNGRIKKTALSAYSRPKRGGIIAIKLEKDDYLIGARTTSGDDQILLGTAKGLAIRFHEKDLRPMGRATQGVVGVRLKKDDRVVSMILVESGVTVLTVCERGFGKRSKIEDYRLQSRGGKGVINIKTSSRNGNVVAMRPVRDDDEVMMITQGGMAVRIPVKDIRVMGRATQGVRVVNLKPADRVVSIAKVEKEED